MLHHFVAIFFILALGVVIGIFAGEYSIGSVWLVGFAGFTFWQLLYVMPLIRRFKQEGKIGIMKGVMIGAAVTALLNGTCFLLML